MQAAAPAISGAYVHGAAPRKRLALRAAALVAALVIPAACAAESASPPASPLATHLAAKREAIAASRPTETQKLTASVTAESRSGVRRLRVDGFQLLSDSDRDYAGYSLGAGSWDTQIAVLASAVADEFIIQAAAQNIPLDSLDVIFTSRPDDPSTQQQGRVRYPRNLGYVAHIESSASDEQLEALRQSVERISPVLNLVSASQSIGHGEVIHTPSPALRDPALPPGLRDFLVEKRAAILRRQERARQPRPEQTQPAEAPGLRAHASVEPHTGLRQVVTGDGQFRFLHDSSANLVGYGLAPTVEQHQLGVLGTCLTHIFEIQAATRQVVLDSLEVRLEADLSPRVGSGDAAPPRYSNVRYTVHVESPASPEEITGLRDAVEASCPLYNLLKDEQTIQGEVARGRYVPS